MKDIIKYCESCHKEVEFKILKEEVKFTIANSQVIVSCDVPRCIKCGTELNDNDLFEKNSKLARDKYIIQYNILSIQDIKDILNKYDIGATILSKVLGWGDITITRYLNGKLASKTYSDRLREIDSNPQLLLSLLETKKSEISDLGYSKCKNKIMQLNEVSMTINDNETTINDIVKYIISKVEITPLALQKTLYFIQGFSIAFNNKFIYNDIPHAWVHGPVYPEIYRKYKEFGYNPIENEHVLNENIILDTSDKELTDTVIKYLGLYNGTILEKITHIEFPWLNARKGLKSNEYSDEPINLDELKDYFIKVKNKYEMLSYLDISNYARDMLNKVI